MLGRQVIGFLPAQVVPALASFASVYVFTRLASPSEYGLFALAMSIAQMCQSVFFYWIQVGATRHIDSARHSGTFPALESAVYRSHATTFAVLAAVCVAALPLLPLDESVRNAMWFALAIVGLRSLVTVNQAFHRGELRATRFNVIECTQAVTQLGLGLSALLLLQGRAAGLLASAAVASLLVAAIDARAVLAALRRPVARAEIASLLRFGLPLSASFALNYLLSTSDRLLVEYFLGSAAVGVYSVAYSLMDRAISSIFVAVSLVAFPLAIRAFEREGAAAAAIQLRANGRLLLGTALPAGALLICLNHQIAAVMVGEAFRADAEAIMPWVVMAALMAGFQLHFFDHAFHLGRRTLLSLCATGPAALVNIGVNMWLLPRIGLMGAVWATLAGYAVSLAGSIVIGGRVLKVPLDLTELTRVAGACAVMVLAVHTARTPDSVAGLAAACCIALASYGAAALAFDVAGIRSRLGGLWTRESAS
jgi:O-antigen/teichoic acid export membrane protein